MVFLLVTTDRVHDRLGYKKSQIFIYTENIFLLDIFLHWVSIRNNPIGHPEECYF
jgi:hypothetical protein